MEIIKISDIKPAAYNPRKLSQEAFVNLQGSLNDLGFILPIIVNRDNKTIVAGHQRTKAATAIGIHEVPAYFVSGVQLVDEILFNQVHNGIESEPKEKGLYKGNLEVGKFYDDIPNKDFDIPNSGASYVKDMCMLITRYGDALSAIICDGQVVFGNNYVRAAQILDIPVHGYILDKKYLEKYNFYFSKDYGVYSYDHLDREDFVQGLAQPPRAAGMEWSTLYRVATKWILKDQKDVSVFDFGCGKAMCVDKLKKKYGYKNAIGLEFFNHNRKGISVDKGQEMITKLINFVKKNGKFDYCIAESVINSVNCVEAERSVIAILMLFCKPGGKIFFCGRSKETILSLMTQKRNTTDEMFSARFLDENGLTAIMVEGQWFYQKFHSKEDVQKLIDDFGFKVFYSDRDSYWRLGVEKTRELSDEEYMAAIDYEFNMKLPNNQRYHRHNDIRELFGFPTIEDKEK